MGVTFRYVSQDTIGPDRLDSLWMLWRAQAPCFESRIGELRDAAFLQPKKALPSLAGLSGVQIISVRVQGHIPPEMDTKEAFREVFNKGKESIGSVGGLSCSVGFEEISSRQSRRAYDTLSVTIAEGRRRFITYCANGSKVMKDPAYTWHFVQDFVQRLVLPVRFKVVGSHFYLEHDDPEMTLQRLRAGLDGADPCGFRCEVDWEDEVLLEKMFDILPVIATDRRFDIHWAANTIHESPSPEESDRANRAFWEQVIRCEFPADGYFVHIDLRVRALADLEALGRLCGPDDVSYVTLCTFAIEEEIGEVRTEIKTQGYRLLFECSAPVDVARLSAILGIAFREKR